MFKKGDRVRLHDGSVHVMRHAGLPPRRANRSKPKQISKAGRRSADAEGVTIRGFARRSLIDCLTGEEQIGDWHENTITTYGHAAIIRAFAGMAGSVPANWWGIGSETAAASNYSTLSALASEFGLQSNSAANAAGGSRAAPIQSIAGAWTLSQTFQYASSHLPHNVVLGHLALYGVSTVGGGTALSIGSFEPATKASTVALNLSYHWAFGT